MRIREHLVEQARAHNWADPLTAEGLTQRVRYLNYSGVIRAMVEGLRQPYTDEIAMWTFAGVADIYKTGSPACYGCAATQVMCAVLNKEGKEYAEERESHFMSPLLFGVGEKGEEFLDLFTEIEDAIDELRCGSFEYFKGVMKNSFGLPELEEIEIKLPILNDGEIYENLAPYEELADRLEELGH